MFKSLSLSLIFIVCIIFNAVGQEAKVSSLVHTQYKINSAVMSEERSILVRVPPNYDGGTEKYPVVYMLDGIAHYLNLMPAIIESQAAGKQMPEMILVSIQNTNRNRDLTPTVDKNKKYLSGNADKFLQFIETEVIPLVEKNYRTQPYRIFAGHSLGGLTVVHSFLTQPDLFNAYIAVSPYLHWDNNFPVKRAEEVFKQKKDWKKTMFLALGDEPEYVAAFDSFKALLDKTKPQNFDYEFVRYMDEIHTSMPLRAYNAGLRKIYAGYYPPLVNSPAALEALYKKLSEKFGYQINPPDDAFYQMSLRLGRENKFSEAIEFLKRSIEIFPNNLTTYGVLGETYEKNNQLRQAGDAYEKGYKLSVEKGSTQLAEAFKRDFERVSGKPK